MPHFHSSLLLACLARLVATTSGGGQLRGATTAGGYTCELEQRGFHILQWEGCAVSAWKDSLRKEPMIINFAASAAGQCDPDFSEILRKVEDRLDLQNREPYQQPWRYFTPQGAHVADKAGWDQAMSLGPVFLIEGGQFQWPPVSIGFRQRVDGLVNDAGGATIELETLSVRPPIFRVDGLASEQETNALIKYAKPHLQKAGVVYMDHDKGKPVDEFRTSLNHRPQHNETPLVAAMEARASALTRIPASHFENVQILEYGKGGYYHAHDDAARLEFYAKDKNAITGHHYGYFDRMVTVFWYMNTITSGGETNFPRAHAGPVPWTMQKCIQGLMVAPVQGMAVMWYNMDPRGLVDQYSLHAACAVGEGEKHAINIWVYNKPRETPPAKWDPKHPRVKIIRGGGDHSDESEDQEDDQLSVLSVNEAASKVELYWIGPDSEVKLAELEPGEQSSMNSFEGHRFTAKLSSGVVVGTYVMKGKPRRQKFVISDVVNKEL